MLASPKQNPPLTDNYPAHFAQRFGPPRHLIY